MLYVGRLHTAHGIRVRHRRDARLEAGRVQCMRHAREQVRMSEIDKKESYLLTYRSSDVVAGRGSHGHDVRAGHSP